MSKNKSLKFYTRDEVVVHNTPDDFWVIIHGNIIDLTTLIEDRRSSWNDNLEYLLSFGGKDLSHFYHETGEPKTHISGTTGKHKFLFCPASEKASSEINKTPGHYWSTDPLYLAGKLTRQDRRIRIINCLTGRCNYMTVCEEDTIYDIQRKYKKFYNHHAGSYTWRKDYQNGSISGRLNLSRTLTENGLYHEERGIGPPPSIWLFYNDDLTIA